MKIVVLNGSPKGDNSITLHYAKYIQNHFSGHEWQTANIAAGIGRYEKSQEAFNEVIDLVRSSDAVLWTFPLYYCLVCGQMKRFIELIFERKAESAFAGKYAGTLTTSIHFFDHTAHNYMNSVSDDLKMNYIGGFSAGMHDLLKPAERLMLLKFAEHFLDGIKNRTHTLRSFQPLIDSGAKYAPETVIDAKKTSNWKITLLTDESDPQSNLGKMIEVFVRSAPNHIEVLNICDIDMKGGCLGCIHCSYDSTCVYHDGYREAFESKVKTADAVVFAGIMKDRYLSAKWKTFFDRSFYKGHTPVLKGKKAAWLISGPLRQNMNLREIIEGYTQIVGAYLAGIATDEYGTEQEITLRLVALANDLIWSLEKDYVIPKNFLGFTSHLLFRDFLYRSARFPFIADHKYYKRHNLYDMPHKDFRGRAMGSLMSLLFRIPSIRRSIQKDMIKHMVTPYRKIIDKESNKPE